MNKVILAGNLTKDPDMRYTPNGKAVASFTVAVNEGKDKVEFINCIAWEQNAEFLTKYFGKGSGIIVQDGKIQTRKWEDKSGGTRYTTEVVAFRLSFPPGKGERPKDQLGKEVEVNDNDIPF